jgi:hypothetical protein
MWVALRYDVDNQHYHRQNIDHDSKRDRASLSETGLKPPGLDATFRFAHSPRQSFDG